ncbi:mechanosensitive ion channel family protein [Dyella humicola]|uniref:mechanosensitive ion channel family protein n=1 Tax=Dyella humicola TaxID=2992126 RepID=UPI002252D903
MTTLSVPIRSLSARDRAAAASKRIGDLLDKLTVDDISEVWAESGADKGVIVRADNVVLFAILTGDVAGGDRAAVEQEAHRAAEVLRSIVKERSEARRPMELFTDIAITALATLVLVALCWLLVRLNRVVQRRLIAIARARLRLTIAGFDFRPLVWSTLRRLVSLVNLLLVLFLCYLWLSYVLRLFPYSRPWGAQLGQYMIDLGMQMLSALVEQIPNLLTLVVIFLITRGIVRLISTWFHAVENGTVQVGWLEPPTASITRKLASLLIGLFALVVAYPYIPGAGSDAFKGVSVFVGLMLSLGSAGIVNQLMSGLVVLYSRAVRVGDFVHVGDHEGTVREMGALSIKLVTRTHEEVIIPNAVLSSTPMRNLTRQLPEGGLLLTTSVTIGYDTPWRQVEGLLELAASRTTGLLREPRPFVLQTALSDYYVEYLLNVGTLHPSIYKDTLSELHRNIQDAFNEFGVQIMSPHFRRQPDEKVWSPAEHWYDPPAHGPAISDRAEASDSSKGSAAPAADSGPPT